MLEAGATHDAVVRCIWQDEILKITDLGGNLVSDTVSHRVLAQSTNGRRQEIHAMNPHRRTELLGDRDGVPANAAAEVEDCRVLDGLDDADRVEDEPSGAGEPGTGRKQLSLSVEALVIPNRFSAG